jgi:1-pyrroline-5-carboxylate dehydrogenase
MPHNHAKALATFPTSTPELAQEAIEAALSAQADWETMPFNDRAAIFLRVRCFLHFTPFSSRN